MTPTETIELPSKKKLLKTTLTAAGVAVIVLVTTVMPAEYGIDPLGTGRLTGLKAISAPPPRAEAPPPGATVNKPVQEGPVAHYAASFKTDAVEFKLGPYEYLEYKYRLESGAHMIYSWTATADLKHDFHGDPDDKALKEQSYDKKPRREGHGEFTAPFSGIHGWFWENLGTDTVTIRLTSSGFYSSGIEMRSDRTRRQHELSPPRGAAGN